jgi:hypothetical protein
MGGFGNPRIADLYESDYKAAPFMWVPNGKELHELIREMVPL